MFGLLAGVLKTKVEGESACEEYLENYDLTVVAMRMSNIYGPTFQVKPSLTVIPLFILKALSNQPLIVHGDGKQTRDFVYVEGIGRGLKRALNLSKIAHQTYNIGSGVTTSINELADLISGLMKGLYDRKIKTKHVKPPKWRKEAKKEFKYSIQKIKEELNYEPKFSLKDGMQEIFKRIQGLRT